MGGGGISHVERKSVLGFMTRSQGYKTFFMLNSTEHEIYPFIVLINVKMSTIVGILTFISRINTTSESLKARKVFIFQHFSLYEQLKFLCSVELSMLKFYNLGGQVFCLAT